MSLPTDDEMTPEQIKASALAQGWEWDDELNTQRRPGLLGKLDKRSYEILAVCQIEGASVQQYATWMTSAMAEVIRDANAEDFLASNLWLNRHREGER